jgi:hypothetical protein
MSFILKTTISSQNDFFDSTGQLIPKGNYYFNIRKIENNNYIGDLYCRGSYGEFIFNHIDVIKMMSVAQSRLARRCNIENELMPNYDSPNVSPRKTSKYVVQSTNLNDFLIKKREEKPPPPDNCTICLKEILSDSKRLICNHNYHKNCINKWLTSNNTCPICRKEIHDEISEMRRENSERHLFNRRNYVRNMNVDYHRSMFAPENT